MRVKLPWTFRLEGGDEIDAEVTAEVGDGCFEVVKVKLDIDNLPGPTYDAIWTEAENMRCAALESQKAAHDEQRGEEARET